MSNTDTKRTTSDSTDIERTEPSGQIPAGGSAVQPTRVLQLGETRLTLLGTAHVSRTSADEVGRLLESGAFDAVAIELDPNRYANLSDPDRFAKLDLFRVIKEGKTGMVAANLVLGAFQQRLADQMGIQPGQEFRVAISAAESAGLPLFLIDRDIGITLQRVYRGVSWWRRMTLLSGLAASLLSRQEISEEEIEKLKEGDMLEATFAEFAEESRSLYVPLIAERDHYMAARLREETAGTSYRNILVVVGAGHLAGITERLEAAPSEDPHAVIRELDTLPPPSPWLKVLPWLLVGLLVLGFALGFLLSPDLGWGLIGQWVLLNGGLGALGALIALAHPLTIVATFVMAPIGTLHPLLGVGMIAAAIELWLRRPQVGDFGRLRQDVTRFRGWWQNRVARVFLVFVLTTLGASLGNGLAGINIITRLMGRLFG
ncbi:MAG TPA: TraB/GumN family protein [Trueperaceae bacterium]